MLIGLAAFNGDADAMRRQQTAVSRLTRLAGIEGVNVQFRTATPASVAGIETLAALAQDSLVVAGPGRRSKPMTRELFDVLAATASARGHEYFGYINSDIVVLPAALEAIARRTCETYAICRYDVDDIDGMRNGSQLTSGIDMFVFSLEWWRDNVRRFRPYVIGDACWDTVYTSVMMCHSNGTILNREPLILHERHETAWNDATSSARYNGFMAALDSRYFTLWCQYHERLERARASGSTESAEQELRQKMFVWRPSAVEAVKQSLRSVRARLRFQRLRASIEQSATR